MIDGRLLGRWHGVAGGEPVTMEFESDGSLTYTIHTASSDQVIFLRYTIEGDVIVSDQPSAPREERTAYRITADDRLVMVYDGEKIFSRLAQL